MLINIARGSLHEFLGDRVIYRNLNAADLTLPRFVKLQAGLDLQNSRLPRKSEGEYAQVVAKLLSIAQTNRGISRPLQRLLYIGDTQMLDGTAFSNLCMVTGWSGLAFIGSEDNKSLSVTIEQHPLGGQLYLANRWNALQNFAAYLENKGFIVDETTAVVIDLDKTALGARGRNGGVIDQARLQAVYDTAESLLGGTFDRHNFQIAYEQLNHPEFHPFTTDNQDYLVYICLVLNCGYSNIEQLLDDVRAMRLNSFLQFITQVHTQIKTLPRHFQEVHQEIYSNVQTGDPTPFKAFRRQEYLRTITCFGKLSDNAPVENMLTQEILITGEVRQVALVWQTQGALLFGLSDKPDEAATPTEDLEKAGYEPIHRALTHVVEEEQIYIREEDDH